MHNWGRQNRVLFDASKEEFAILHATEGNGEDFILLGAWIVISICDS